MSESFSPSCKSYAACPKPSILNPSLEETVKLLRKQGVAVMLCEANQRVRAKLYRAGVVTQTSDPTCDRSLVS